MLQREQGQGQEELHSDDVSGQEGKLVLQTVVHVAVANKNRSEREFHHDKFFSSSLLCWTILGLFESSNSVLLD